MKHYQPQFNKATGVAVKSWIHSSKILEGKWLECVLPSTSLCTFNQCLLIMGSLDPPAFLLQAVCTDLLKKVC